MQGRLVFEKRENNSWRCYAFVGTEALGYRTWYPGGREQWIIVDEQGHDRVFAGADIPTAFVCQPNGSLVLKPGCQFVTRCNFAGQWV